MSPQRLGPYRLVHQVGGGGMGVVHLALDEQGRAVAVKVLRPHLAADPQARARLAREADTLRLVRSPRVAEVLDTDPDADPPYIVTEYVPAPPLDEHVADAGPLRGRDLLRLGLGLGEALSAIHRAGVVHRDLKPANVLVDDGEPVVIDFGIAQITDDVRLTSTGLVMGTPGYLSPEVIDGAPVSVVGDWWGWAATLVFAATGRPPFGTGPLDAVLARVHRGTPDVAGVAEPVASLLLSALAPDPADRPTPRALREALQAAAEGAPAPALDLRPPVRAAASRSAGGRASAGAATTVVPGGPADVARGAATTALAAPADGATELVGPASAAAAPAATAAATAPLARRAAPAPCPLPPADPWSQLPVTTPVREGGPATHGDARADGHDRWGDHRGDQLGDPWAGQRSGHGSELAMPEGQPALPAPAWPDEEAPVPGRLRSRTGTLVLLLVAVALVAAVAPVWAGIILAAGSVASRTVERAGSSLLRRQHSRGARSSDAAMTALAAPVHLLAAAAVTVPALLLPLLMGISAAFLTGWAVTPGASPAPGSSLPLAVGGLSAVLTAWWGPAGASLRRGTRQCVRGVSPTSRSATVLAGALALVVLAAALVVLGGDGQPDWSPLAGPPLGIGAASE